MARRPRRVLFLIDTGGPGGAETVFSSLVERLDPTGWQPAPAVPSRDWLYYKLESMGVEPVLLPTTGPFDLRYLVRIIRAARSTNAQLIHAHLLTSSVYGCIAGLLLRLPVVCTFHGTADISPADRHLNFKFRILRNRAARIVFVSRYLQQRFESLGLNATQSEVIPNGIDVALYESNGRGSLRGPLGADGHAILVGAIGNVRSPKAYDILLKALAILKQTGPRCRCVIVGDTKGVPELTHQLLELRNALGLEAEVDFTGFREDIPRILRSLDICTVSSSSEGFSLTTVQALAAGVPVVATRSGGPEEIIEDGHTGILVPTGNPEALAEAIRELALDADLRRRIGRCGRETVRRRYDVAGMVARYEILYERILAE